MVWVLEGQRVATWYCRLIAAIGKKVAGDWFRADQVE
jgi:hypothetical protein